MAAVEVIVRFLHVFLGMVWVGGSVFYGHSVAGGLSKQPPQVRGPAMLAIMSKMSTLFLTAGSLTILFGVWNQFLIEGEINFMRSTWNVLLGAALAVAVIMLAIGLAWQMPNMKRLKAASATPGPPSSEAPKIVKRLMIGGLTITLLGVVSVALMVAAVLARTGSA